MSTFRGCKVILVRADGTHGSQFTPAHGHKIKIGSSINCDIRLKNVQETRGYHCIISREKANNVFKIKNLSRKHPVSLNGVPIKKKTERELKNGDMFTVAQRQFLWLSKNKSKQLPSGTSEENTEQQQNPEKKRMSTPNANVPVSPKPQTPPGSMDDISAPQAATQPAANEQTPAVVEATPALDANKTAQEDPDNKTV